MLVDLGYKLSLWSLLCRVPSYTVIVPCLSKARTTDFGPEPSLDSPASPKYYSSLHKIINESSLRSIVFPLDLNPRLPAPDFRMSQLPSNAIGLNNVVTFEIIYQDLGINPTVNLFRVFQILCKQGDWFSFTKRRGVDTICMDDNPSSLKLWKHKFFLIDHRAILDYITWKSTKSCVSDDFPTDGSDTNDVSRLCARSAKLRDISKAILVRSSLSSVWLNRGCDPVFRKKDDNTGSDVVVVEESHELDTPILQRVKNHTTVPTIEGTLMSPLKLSNRMNVLTSLLVLHGTEMNVLHTSLARSIARLKEKVKFKMDQLDKFWFEFFDLKVKHEKTQKECHGRDQENKELQASNHALSDEVKA
nr:hypothetical protein [Tanacetum cinerariifolium]